MLESVIVLVLSGMATPDYHFPITNYQLLINHVVCRWCFRGSQAFGGLARDALRVCGAALGFPRKASVLWHTLV
jgi:hypothetical protein